ncbi:hypothetical protein OAO51_04555 [Nitrosomonadaceae bacterium]|nr:hypothetical protein [Nitrosomonadaceae bacterium]
MKIFNILIFSILITTNVYAGGVYGNLYNKSDLVSDKSNFEIDQERKRSNAKREKIERIEEAERQRQNAKQFDEGQRRSRR